MPLHPAMISALGRAVEGQRVWFLASSQKAARAHFLSAPVDISGATYRLTNGNESITFPNGGVINFRSPRSSGRGFTADRIYVPYGTQDTVLEDILPALATSKDGAVISY